MDEGCDAAAHYSCAECSSADFYLEEVGYGRRRAWALDDEHRPQGKIIEERDAGAESEWLGPCRYFVRCEVCDREIEFGWSHENRGGRVWPTEASCFNPWRSFPEPRYRRAWKTRGWLRAR